MSETPLTLTLDVGTSSTRVLVWETSGHEIADVRGQVPYAMHTTPDGGVEMPAEELFGHVADALDQALHQLGDRASAIKAVGVSTFWHSLVGLDALGQALTPIYNWSDARSGDVARRLRAHLDANAIHARTGCVIHPSYYPAKLVWLRETQPDLFYQVKRWASPSEFLYRRLFGDAASWVSLSIASGTGLFHQERGAWDQETLDTISIPIETLAPIVDVSERVSGLQKEFADRWPALRDAPFFPAIGDGACGNVGSGCVTPARFAINVGTSGAIRALWDERATPHSANVVPALPPGLWRYRADGQRPLIGAAFSDGGIVYAWMTKTLQLPPPDELERQLSQMEPGAHGLTFLPFLAGERSIGWNPDARAAIAGMNLDTSPLEILRAAMEAVALRFGLAAQLLRGLFPQAQEIIASGNALAHSPAWAQMFADALGQPVILAAEAEASSRGAALIAMEAAGLTSGASLPDARLGQAYPPNLDRHAQYMEMLKTQQALYAQLVARQ